MEERMRASLEDIAAGYQERLTELRRMQEDVRKVTATARTRDGMVTVEEGVQGELRDIKFDPRAFDRTRPKGLARTIMELVGEATRDAAGRGRQITAALLPADLAAELGAFLPDAPSIRDDSQG